MGELATTPNHALSHAYNMSVLALLRVAIRSSAFLAVLVGLVAVFYAPNDLIFGWVMAACLVLLTIGHQASSVRTRLGANEIGPSDAERWLCRMALITGTTWAVFPLCAWSSTPTGWILNALALLAAMTTASLLFGLSWRSQIAVLLPILLVTTPVFVRASGNPGIAAVTVLIAMILPILTLGKLVRRTIFESIELATQTEELNDDLTEANALLAHSAYHDVLTGLPNRAGFSTLVAEAQQEAAATGTGYALAFLDLDRFKQINDLFGHAVGDDLLLSVAQRLDEGSRGLDTVGRHGGDEFLCLFRDLDGATSAMRAANHLLSALDRPIELGDQEFSVAVSIGVAYADGSEPITLDELRVRADHALYEAKDRGRNRVHLFDAELDEAVTRRQETEKRLREALRLGRITGWFQPVVELETGLICGVESLVRWLDDGTVKTPGSFLGVAEEALLGWPITRTVLSSVAFLGTSLERQGQSVPIAVNVSPEHVENAIDHLIDLTGVPDLSGIIFEITETRLIDDMAGLRRSLAEIRGLGGRVMLDDFGTGYSSLSLLAELPIDGVKIDCSFTSTIVSSEISRTIVAAIIDIAGRMGLDVIAEGVETVEQMHVLRELGVGHVQGYLFSAAIPADELEAQLLARRPFTVSSKSAD